MKPKLGRGGRTAGLVLVGGSLLASVAGEQEASTARTIGLPAPRLEGRVSVERALEQRRSQREFEAAALTLQELSQLLWAAQGQNRPDGGRTAPSAGALYPLEVYVAAGNVAGLTAGVYRYLPAGHGLAPVAAGDRRRALATAALGQDWIRSAPAVFVIAAVYERTARKYGLRAPQYVHFEAGCAAENVALQAVALGLGTVVVGAFQDGDVVAATGLRAEERPLAILPVGRP